MSFINYQAHRKLLVIIRGHPFSQDQFRLAFDGLDDIDLCFVEHPAAQHLFTSGVAAEYDAYIFYDMPGLDFSSAEPPEYQSPPDYFKQDLLALLEQGKGMVFLHHAIAGWPAWPEYSEIIGGRFLYKQDHLHEQVTADSGYRHDVTHTLTLVEDHPVTEGVNPSFDISDELYLSEVFSDSIHPLLKSDYDFVDSNFYSAYQAVKGNMFSRESWSHPKGSSIVGWYKHYLNSPIVYLQCGDNKTSYENPQFQRLVANAVNWVASEGALEWAKDQP